MQRGKLNVTKTPQGWNCNSGCDPPEHCILPRCTNVAFPQTFSGSGTVGVLDLRRCDVEVIVYINREAVEFNNEPWECQGMHFTLPHGIWLGPQSQFHPAPNL